jgi:hypothetical protein
MKAFAIVLLSCLAVASAQVKKIAIKEVKSKVVKETVITKY